MRPPPGPSGLPILGCVVGFRYRSRIRFLAALRSRHGDVCGFDLLGRRLVLVGDPQIGRAVLAGRDDAYGLSFASELAALELVAPPASGLMRGGAQRAVPGASPDAAATHVRAPAAALEERSAAVVAPMVARWAAAGPRGIDVRDAAGSLATALAFTALFDVPLTDGEPEELHAMVRAALTRGRSARWVPRAVRARRRERFAAAKSRILARIPGDRIGAAHRDGLSALLLAAISPMSSALAWMLLHLAADRDGAGRVAHDAAWRDAFLREVLRRRPPAWALERTATRDHELGGWTVRAGTSVLVSPWLIHHHPAHWDEPGAFRPERFRSGPAAPTAWLPFGAGAKSCPASAAAMAMLGGALAAIARGARLASIGRMPEPWAETALMPGGRPRVMVAG